MQAQFMALLTLSQGDSLITETVFENPLRHVAELNRTYRVKGNNAIVGGIILSATVVATDLRGSLGGAGSKGKDDDSGLHHLDRGYDQLETKLLGELDYNARQSQRQMQIVALAPVILFHSSKRLIDCMERLNPLWVSKKIEVTLPYS